MTYLTFFKSNTNVVYARENQIKYFRFVFSYNTSILFNSNFLINFQKLLLCLILIVFVS